MLESISLTRMECALSVGLRSRFRSQGQMLTEQIPETLPRTQAHSRPDTWSDVLVIGAGPTGLACAIEVQKVGLKALILDKGCLVNSIYNYPANMVFFTTPELLEVGDIPFSTAHQKPTRQEALEYYRKVAEHYRLQVCQYQWVKTITGKDGDFHITATDRSGKIYDYRSRKIVVATGYYDMPNMLGIPGEALPKVFHYYREPHSFYDHDVLVIGGKNSAAEEPPCPSRHRAPAPPVHPWRRMHNHPQQWAEPYT